MDRWLVLWVALLLASLLHGLAESWKTDRRPKVYGDKIPRKMLVTTTKKVQRNIVKYHNLFRTHVTPPAANMLKMTWHRGAAKAAQRWSDQCQMLTHDGLTGRWVENYGSCGQNIFISTQQVPWYFAIKMWYVERHNFTYGSTNNDLHVVGHYTQMVWASSHKVGCGFTKCVNRRTTYYSYICNYCPIGNVMERLGQPYERGRPCSKCAGHCRRNKLCTNSCPAADMWANCNELNATWHDWLCDRKSEEARERRKFCRATCFCNGKII